MRQTSIDIYRRIEAEGLLSDLRFSVYKVLFEHGPLTAGEVWSRFFHSARQRSSISARMSELEDRGVVFQAEERECGYTGNRAIAWDVTLNLPREPLKVPTEPCPHCKGKGKIPKRLKKEEPPGNESQDLLGF